MLKKAQQKLEAEGLFNTGYTLADADKVPFEGYSFDLIFLVAVLGEITEQDDFLSAARRVLRPGGILSISEHFPDPEFSALTKVKSVVQGKGCKYFEHYGV